MFAKQTCGLSSNRPSPALLQVPLSKFAPQQKGRLCRRNGTWSRRYDAKPRDISALLRSSVSAALTTHRVVIHYRAPSSPVVKFAPRKRGRLLPTSFVVRETGLEPVRCYPHAPQTCASASSATLAGCFGNSYIISQS